MMLSGCQTNEDIRKNDILVAKSSKSNTELKL